MRAVSARFRSRQANSHKKKKKSYLTRFELAGGTWTGLDIYLVPLLSSRRLNLDQALVWAFLFRRDNRAAKHPVFLCSGEADGSWNGKCCSCCCCWGEGESFSGQDL